MDPGPQPAINRRPDTRQAVLSSRRRESLNGGYASGFRDMNQMVRDDGRELFRLPGWPAYGEGCRGCGTEAEVKPAVIYGEVGALSDKFLCLHVFSIVHRDTGAD